MEYRVIRTSKSDELMHHKYVKKKKVNGKWRYYYDVKDALGYDEKQAMNTAKVNSKIAEVESKMALDKYNDTKNKIDEHYNNKYLKNPKTGTLYKAAQKARDVEKSVRLTPLHADYTSKKATAAIKGREYAKANEAYMKTPLAKIDAVKGAVNKGKNKIRSLFNKTRK